MIVWIPCFGAVNETVIRVAAEKLVSLGLAEAGYSYLNIDGA